MPLVILGLFIGIPLIEIYLFIEVGGWIGVWPTIALVIVTAFIGTSMLRQQGLATLARAQAEINQDRLPLREIFNGFCLLVGGVLLLTPGFLTDGLGFALLIPPLRAVIGRGLWKLLERSKGVHFSVHGARATSRGGPGGRNPTGAGPVIDGEEFGVARDDDDDDDDDRNTNGRTPRLGGRD
jgi:UPF0716 protein FxsA